MVDICFILLPLEAEHYIYNTVLKLTEICLRQILLTSNCKGVKMGSHMEKSSLENQHQWFILIALFAFIIERRQLLPCLTDVRMGRRALESLIWFFLLVTLLIVSTPSAGYRTHEKKKSHKYDSKSSRLRKKPREKEGASRRAKTSSQRPARSHSDDEEDEGVPASYHTVSFQVSLDVSTMALSLIPKSVHHHVWKSVWWGTGMWSFHIWNYVVEKYLFCFEVCLVSDLISDLELLQYKKKIKLSILIPVKFHICWNKIQNKNTKENPIKYSINKKVKY